jgi:hypothetical protein
MVKGWHLNTEKWRGHKNCFEIGNFYFWSDHRFGEKFLQYTNREFSLIVEKDTVFNVCACVCVCVCV